MHEKASYDGVAKAFHWLIVTLLVAQYALGWLMPDIHGAMKPGAAMVWHISLGMTILALMLLRLLWRLTHQVLPDSSLSPFQRVSSALVHGLLYGLVLLATGSGWLFASARGWQIPWFFGPRLPMLTGANRPLLRTIDGWHQVFEWALLAVIGVHVLAALVHAFYHRDGVIKRMLPGT